MEKCNIKNQSLNQSPEKNKNLFCTSDFGLSAALISIGYPLISLDRTNPRKVQFVFNKKEKIEEDVIAYWNDQLQVKAKTYFDATKMLKNRLYSE